jgi:uncharacterized membrane protein
MVECRLGAKRKMRSVRISKWAAQIVEVIRRDPFVYIAVAAYAAIFSILNIVKYHNFGFGHDLAFFNQSVWLFSQGKSPFISVVGINVFGVHFDPILLLLVPIYKIFPGALTLQILQVLFLATAAIPLYHLSKAALKDRFMPIAVVLSFFFFPAFMWVSLAGFYTLNLVLPALLWAFFFLQRSNKPLFLLCMLLALMCREDVSLTVLFLGLYMIFGKHKKLGLFISGVSAIWFIASTEIIIPYFLGGPYTFYSQYSDLGRNVWQIAANALINPAPLVSKLFTRMNIEYLFKIFSPVGFIPLFSPETLAIALPGFASNLLSSSDHPHFISSWNTSILTPFVFISLIFGLKRILEAKDRYPRLKLIQPKGLSAFVLLCSVVASIAFGPLFNPRTTSYLSNADHSKKLNELVSLIPGDVSVSADIDLLPELSKREQIYLFPNPFYNEWYGINRNAFQKIEISKNADKVEYILLDTIGMRRLFTEPPFLSINPIKYVETLEELLGSDRFGILYCNDGIILMRRGEDHVLGMERLENDPATKGYLQRLIDIKKYSFSFGGDDWRTYAQKGLEFANKGMIDKAIGEFEKAIKLNPNEASLYNNLGAVFVNKGMLREAVECFKYALVLDPNLVAARQNLGYALERLK